MRKCYDFAKIYSNLIHVWKPFCEEINRIENEFEKKFHPPVRRLAGKFLEIASEMWVAAELQKHHHEVKVVHKRKHADLYIGNLGIEVKGSTRHVDNDVPWWGFQLGKHSQVYERDYRVLILVRADENSIPFDCFVITKGEIERYPPCKSNDEKYYINLEEKYPDYPTEYGRQGTELEKKLHLQHSDFKDRWDKILGMVK